MSERFRLLNSDGFNVSVTAAMTIFKNSICTTTLYYGVTAIISHT